MSDPMRRPVSLAARARWQRWEMDPLEDPHTSLRQHRANDTPAQAEAALRARAQAQALAREEVRQRAWQEGHAQGLRAGHEEGLKAGHDEGFAQGREQGRAAGHQEGLAQGHTEGAAQAREIAARIDGLAGTCATALDTLEQEAGQALIRLATRMAERILHAQLQTHPEHILALVGDVLQTTTGQEAALTLRLHPLDLELVQQHLPRGTGPARYELTADEQISRGGCIVETAGGCVDATLETRWLRVTAALGQRPPEP